MTPDGRVAQMDRQLLSIRKCFPPSNDPFSAFSVHIAPQLQRLRDLFDESQKNGNDAQTFRAAAEHGDAVAMRKLGNCYMNGWNVRRDLLKAETWFRKAAKLGDVRSVNNLGIRFSQEQKMDKAFKWFQEAANLGSEHGMCNLANGYFHGTFLTQDFAMAFKWLRQAADHGSPEAMHSLGHYYEYGDGIEKDTAEAVKWYRRGVELKSATAMSDMVVWRQLEFPPTTIRIPGLVSGCRL